MSKAGSSANYGIQGNVNATAVAVGPHATATVHQNAPASRAEFDQLLETLRGRLDELQLPPDAHQTAQQHLAKIESMAGDQPGPKPAAADLFSRLVNGLKSAGVLLEAAAGLHQPLLELAAWFHLPLGL